MMSAISGRIAVCLVLAASARGAKPSVALEPSLAATNLM
jgi:hypothetical protein